MEWLNHPFTYGLGLGVVGIILVWLNAVIKRRSLVKEVRELRKHLHRQMEINQKGQDHVRTELEDLRKQNENLRVTNATLKQKPGRAELQTLVAYDKALRKMQGRVPGFAQAWENVLSEAEKEVEQSESGILPLIRKAFLPSLKKGNAEETTDSESVDQMKKALPDAASERREEDRGSS